MNELTTDNAVIACLVKRMGGKVRIPFKEIQNMKMSARIVQYPDVATGEEVISVSESYPATVTSLSEEYLRIVEDSKSGLYDTLTVNRLNSDRAVLHDQLLEAIGETRESNVDMVATCKAILYYEGL